ncbi:hypothetical protein BDV19DRAFT_165648 [Aspergillus venezuelensis]
MAGKLGKQTLSAGIVHINVGPEHNPFDVHLELLCDCSPYFDALYKDRIQVYSTEPESFPDDEPDVFAELISWMYKGSLSSNVISGPHHNLEFIFKLWRLAEKLNISALQTAIDELCVKMVKMNPILASLPAMVNLVYARHTEIKSPLRQFLVNTWAKNVTTKEYSKHQAGLPAEFLRDLCGALIAKIREQGRCVSG